ncbi:MAG: arginine--tRNA ligase [Clostridia bacterium]|nr:arginine--tRNA ligase [Clostridia bacterium]
MVNIIEEVKKQLVNSIENSISAAVDKGDLPCKFEGEIAIEEPREKAHGDFSSNVAMQFARLAKKSPRDVANIIIENFNFDGTYIASAEIAGPGFLNFRLKDEWLYDALKLIEEKGEEYGKQNIGGGKKVMIEFVSANPTGPMHMGNARGGALGDSLAAVLDYCGFDVTREFYLNDAGAQIEKLGKSLEARYVQLIKGEDSMEFPEDGYHGGDIKEHMKAFIEIHGEKYIDVDSEERRKVFAQYALEKNFAKIKADLGSYKINYDVWFPETDLYKSGEVEETIEILKNSGYTYESDGALWLKSTDLGLDKDDVLVRNNGIPTYFLVDIAYHRNKFVKRGFDKVINIWGADHHGHVERMKAAMKAIGVDPNGLDVILMQLVRLMKEGKPVKMSKRTGEMINLADLLEDIGIDAARFFFNLRQADSHFDFDLDLAVEQSNDNPVFYVQYAHARICSILSRLEEEGISLKKTADVNLSLLKEEEEKELIKMLAKYPEELALAAKTYDPTRLTRYSVDLASAFHTFYNACRVKGVEEDLMNARLILVSMVKLILASALNLLGVTAPERM